MRRSTRRILVVTMLRDQISEDMRAAMKAREQTRVGTLRMLMAAVKNSEVERGRALDDDEVLDAITREAKRRRESIDAFTKGGRDELVAKETAELAVLESYLPAALTEAELAALVDEAIAEAGATDPKQMGVVMKVLVPKIRGRADGGAVSALVRARLGA
ncbi:MAG: GatB/YqeY domain-containing protein [Actinomycetota bacterium]